MSKMTFCGAYMCKSHGTIYNYDGHWEDLGGTVQWQATILYDRRVANPSGTIPSIDPDPRRGSSARNRRLRSSRALRDDLP
jgi:hypothetical protein